MCEWLASDEADSCEAESEKREGGGFWNCWRRRVAVGGARRKRHILQKVDAANPILYTSKYDAPIVRYVRKVHRGKPIR